MHNKNGQILHLTYLNLYYLNWSKLQQKRQIWLALVILQDLKQCQIISTVCALCPSETWHLIFERDKFRFSLFQIFYLIQFEYYYKLIIIINLTNLEVYEETDDKNIDKGMWSWYQITFNIQYKHHRRYNACFSSTEKNK